MRRDEAERAISFLSASDNLFVTSLSARLSLGGWIAAMVDLPLQATGLLTVKNHPRHCSLQFVLVFELIWRIQSLDSRLLSTWRILGLVLWCHVVLCCLHHSFHLGPRCDHRLITAPANANICHQNPPGIVTRPTGLHICHLLNQFISNL